MKNNKFNINALLLFILIVSILSQSKEIDGSERDENISLGIEIISKYLDITQRLKNKNQTLTAECEICSIVLNEVEGFVVENLTMEYIQNEIQTHLCDDLDPILREVCSELVFLLPVVVPKIERRYTISKLCVGLKFCSEPIANHTDPVQLPTYYINLDLPPKERWNQICSNPIYGERVREILDVMGSILPARVRKDLNSFGEEINSYIEPEFAQEIQGCSERMGVGYGVVTLFNIAIELTDSCTSIVAQTKEGKILHARNLDFGLSIDFTNALKDIAFIAHLQSKNQTVYSMSTMAGYFGALSGLRANGFSVTINTRFYPQGIKELFYEVIFAMKHKNATMVAFLTREALSRTNKFEQALNILANTTLVCDVYYTVAGIGPGEGAIITRNRYNATDIWRIGNVNSTRYWILETNYDHWKNPPFDDDRRYYANKGMSEIGWSNLSLEKMFKVLSIKPVVNLQTIYTFTCIPYNNTYNTVARYCSYPCTE
eukprot:TRINITY_DN1693_c7_g1_i1.p1 TRINITY_DN1693_c7_g1~~TRINITY_DN1693_c7_g1_i1.p1  ORF type:complete len:489 (-),score=95.81 TRINITY_DN1693_c7_g1_i1:161-1627(-)